MNGRCILVVILSVLGIMDSRNIANDIYFHWVPDGGVEFLVNSHPGSTFPMNWEDAGASGHVGCPVSRHGCQGVGTVVAGDASGPAVA